MDSRRLPLLFDAAVATLLGCLVMLRTAVESLLAPSGPTARSSGGSIIAACMTSLQRLLVALTVYVVPILFLCFLDWLGGRLVGGWKMPGERRPEGRTR